MPLEGVESRCPIRAVMKEIREAVVRIAERVTIAELCERARKLEERKRQLAREGRCPECEQPADTAAPGCLLHQLIQLVRNERTTVAMPARELLRIHVNCNVSPLWLDLGEIIYRLGEGNYSNIRSS